MFSLEKVVAKVRQHYHTNMIDINQVRAQLHLISDEKLEESNRNHFLTLVNDVWPRLYGQDAVDHLFGLDKEE